MSVPLYIGTDIASGFPAYVVNRVLSRVQYELVLHYRLFNGSL